MWVLCAARLAICELVLIKRPAAVSCWHRRHRVLGAYLGGGQYAAFTDYPHPDWPWWYFLALLVFYLCFTRVSESVLDRLMRRPDAKVRATAVVKHSERPAV